MRLRKAAVLLIPSLALAHLCQATTLLSEFNSSSIYDPLGIGSGNGQQAAAIEFSTANPLTNVTISVPLDVIDVNGAHASVSAYLTNGLGVGTTQSNVLKSVNLSVAPTNSVYDYYHYNYNAVSETLFSGLNLAPGTYDVVLIETDGTNNAGIPLDFYGGTQQNAPGVSLNGTFSTSGQGGTFAPAFGGYSNTTQASIFAGVLEFNITGNDLVPTPVPEPSGGLIAGLFLMSVGVFRSRRVTLKQHSK